VLNQAVAKVLGSSEVAKQSHNLPMSFQLRQASFATIPRLRSEKLLRIAQKNQATTLM
jgi:hypothetical protein